MSDHAADERHRNRLRITQLVLSAMTIAALIIAIIGLSSITDARRQSAHDSCVLLLGLVHKAAPASRSAAVDAYIARTPLRNCDGYARRLVP